MTLTALRHVGLALHLAIRERAQTPSSRHKLSCHTGGDIYGVVHENSLMEHRVMLPPGARGSVTYVAQAGQYNINEELIEARSCPLPMCF